MSTDLNWFKSSYSGSQGGECLEIAIAQTAPAAIPTTIHVRDSKTPAAPTLRVTPAPWTAFLAHVTAS
ncbi:DUF397 domain-containing protein [Streptomyces liliifuscus]|uniref:DUF397 domain-containing protein n=1 Tax=Streptomyces liliifuscus TaxID=2797636 RepID=A0A7T7I612_9ACTN|nr:DUF397 domain-containing protein [Streptomyces liliifuscus]QQM41665.1 DUF397 domain-containing protein [Streptomyces liliifuscus]